MSVRGRSKKSDAEDLIRTKMLSRGIPNSHWYVAEGPVRLIYLADGTIGKTKKVLAVDRRWGSRRLEEWLDENVGHHTTEDDLPL